MKSQNQELNQFLPSSNVKDIHDDLELIVFNELRKSGKAEFLGKIKVPLHRVSFSQTLLGGKRGACTWVPWGYLTSSSPPPPQLESGVCKAYALKEKKCLQRGRGVVHLECDLVYHPVRACIRTINPREDKLLEEEQKFHRKVRARGSFVSCSELIMSRQLQCLVLLVAHFL